MKTKKEEPQKKECRKCGDVKKRLEFEPGRRVCMDCTRDRKREYQRAYRAANPDKVREYNTNGAEKRAEYKSRNAAKEQEYQSKYYDLHREHKLKQTRKRRALKSGHEIKSEAPHWTQVGPRDDWTCCFCKKKVAKKYINGARYDKRDPNTPRLHYVISLKKGGHDTFDNVKLAHKNCNQFRN